MFYSRILWYYFYAVVTNIYIDVRFDIKYYLKALFLTQTFYSNNKIIKLQITRTLFSWENIIIFLLISILSW